MWVTLGYLVFPVRRGGRSGNSGIQLQTFSSAYIVQVEFENQEGGSVLQYAINTISIPKKQVLQLSRRNLVAFAKIHSPFTARLHTANTRRATSCKRQISLEKQSYHMTSPRCVTSVLNCSLLSLMLLARCILTNSREETMLICTCGLMRSALANTKVMSSYINVDRNKSNSSLFS